MPNSIKIIADTFCEVYELIKPHLAGEFWDFDQHEIIPGAVYLFGRTEFNKHVERIKELARAGTLLPIFSNPAEGSDTIRQHSIRLGIMDLVMAGKILILTGGYLPKEIPHLYYENYLPKILDYDENLQAQREYCVNWSAERPYKFLFLNGRARNHRKYLLKRLTDLLPSAIWTNLDSAGGPVKLLDSKYEFDFYQEQKDIPATGFVKYKLFNDTWGDIYLKSTPYTDTHFSLVTETVFEYPYTFRTEKIWKPIAIGHPYIAVSNAGYYRDMHNLGFKTFGHLIDESFDSIDNNQDRLERTACVVEDLCQQDLASFSTAAQEVCKYNQQHLADLRIKVRKEFPHQFLNFVQRYK
jgi:hypothetical protein